MTRILLLMCLLSPGLFAQTVYKTIENGVTTYSDSPPDSGPADVVTIDVPPPSGDNLLQERLAQMRDTTDRMADDRRERETHRAALRELQQPPSPKAAIAEAPTNSMITTWGGSYWPGYGRPIRPRPPFRPGVPNHLRPLPQPVPGWPVMQPGNAQLMRPILSSGR